MKAPESAFTHVELPLWELVIGGKSKSFYMGLREDVVERIRVGGWPPTWELRHIDKIEYMRRWPEIVFSPHTRDEILEAKKQGERVWEFKAHKSTEHGRIVFGPEGMLKRYLTGECGFDTWPDEWTLKELSLEDLKVRYGKLAK